ncbi:tape measure protein [Faecalibacillus faecis]|uniref:tape measure protein n=1 Tax=Faecalibacillus faecis TaxID=1982628 RepID=UPI003AB7835F
METYSVKAILSAVDQNFTSTMKMANSSLSGIKSASEGATSSIMKIASGIGVFKALSASANLVKSSISSAMGRQDTMEAFNRTITQITGSAENATKALEDLKKITKGTAYGLDVAAKATQNFVTRGMDLSKATKSVGIWADAVSFYGKGTNEQLETVTDALAKMRTKGTVEMDQLDRMFDIGIDAVGIYAKAVGKSSQEVSDSLSDKTIRTDEFLNVVEKAMEEGTNGVQKIAGAAKEAGASWTGTIDNMKAATTRGVLSIMQAIDDMLSKNKLPQMRKMISQFGKGAETTMNTVANGIKNLKDVGALIPQIGALGSALFVVGGSVDYIKALCGGFDTLNSKIPKLSETLSTLQEKSKILGNTLSNTLNKSSPYLDNLKNKFSKLMPDSTKSSIDNFKNLISGSMSIGKDKVNAVGDSIAQMSFKFQSATGRFSKDGPKIWKVFDKLSSVSGYISNKISPKLGKTISAGFKQIPNAGAKALTSMTSAMSKVFAIAMKSVGPAAILGLVVAGLGIVNNQFGSQIDQMIATVVTQAPKVISNFVKGITSQMPMLASSGAQLLVHLSVGIAKTLPLVVNAGMQILNSIIQGISANAQSIIKSALLIVGTLGGAILNAIPQLLGIGLQFIVSITQGILDNMPLILVGIQTMITNITTAIQTQLPTMIQMGVQILQNIATGIVQMLPQLVVGAIQIITTLINTISENLPTILNGAVEIINTLVDGLINNLPQIIDATVELIGAILNAIITNLPQIMTAGVQIILKLVSGLISAIPHVISGVAKIAKKIISTFKDTNWLEVGINIIKGIAKGISSAAGQLWNAAKGVLGGFKDKVLGFFGIHSPSRWGKWVGKMLDTGFAKGVGNNIRLIANQAQKMFDTVQSYVFDVNTLGMNLSLADGLSGTLNHYIEYNDRYIDDEGGNDDNTEYNFNITTEIDGKTAGKAMAKYTKEELDRMDKHSRRLRGDI